jgi:hypothetical protein
VEFGFGQHVFDFDRRELRRGAALIAREPQVFGLLVNPARNLDRAVSEDDHSEGGTARPSAVLTGVNLRVRVG